MLKTYDEKSRKVFEIMINRNMIPSEGLFVITDKIINQANDIGHSLFKKKPKIHQKNSTHRFHKRITGLNLLHLINERSEKIIVEKVKKQIVEQKCGFLYIISNPSFKDHVKIGITQNPTRRLESYQTYDPYRAYKIENQVFVENIRFLEKEILQKYQLDFDKGEWISKVQLPMILKEIH